MDLHATGLCEDMLLDIGIIGYGLANQLLSKVIQFCTAHRREHASNALPLPVYRYQSR